MIRTMLVEIGMLFAFSVRAAGSTVAAIVGRRLAWRECVTQLWFLAHVTTVASGLVMIPLGVGVALQIGSLADQIGAGSYSGAVVAFLIIGQAGPLVCALIIAGVGGSAICADLGARTIREEIDALEVLGLPVLERLVVPRLIAVAVVCALLNSIVLVIGLGASLLVHVLVLDGNAQSFLRNLVQFSQPSDFVVSGIKALSFALISGVVASYKGLTVRKGAQGVGDAVNETVVLSFVLVFVANLAITQFYPLIVSVKGAY
ncbi:ABC transporter permease [Rhodococcus sp. IEGM 248]|uniref:MlaE family ABC transporter permease n=1 Tax=Rhodococcus opacus TaxID=37919 RepID=UPI0013C032C3|nr:ABC transporter permease [Rhodococcus opacus]MDV7084696.1 ABC transporter permease [Rhodococcus opacus]NDV04180.1 ABC transporter permease [Rhodococcus sp. IEGM 248]